MLNILTVGTPDVLITADVLISYDLSCVSKTKSFRVPDLGLLFFVTSLVTKRAVCHCCDRHTSSPSPSNM